MQRLTAIVAIYHVNDEEESVITHELPASSTTTPTPSWTTSTTTEPPDTAVVKRKISLEQTDPMTSSIRQRKLSAVDEIHQSISGDARFIHDA